MSENTKVLNAPTPAVWRVLSDGTSYARWVVGAAKIRRVDSAWPEVGSNLHHTVGVFPLRFKDSTTITETIPGRLLKMRARVRPIGHAEITFRLVPVGEKTEVTMTEVVDRGFAALFYGRLMRGAMHARNIETLRRLEDEVQEPHSRS